MTELLIDQHLPSLTKSPTKNLDLNDNLSSKKCKIQENLLFQHILITTSRFNPFIRQPVLIKST